MFHRLLNKSENNDFINKEKKSPTILTDETKKEDKVRGLFRGVATGILCPVFTVPIDKITSNLQINRDMKLTLSSVIPLLKDKPMKAYPITATTSVARYSGNYVFGPMITHQFIQLGVDKKTSETVGFFGAGFIDGAVNGPASALRQRYFTDTTSIGMKEAMSKEMLNKSAIATRYVIVRNSLFWPMYNIAAQALEKATHLNEEKNGPVKMAKELAIGGIAGFTTTLATCPIDSFKSIRIANPERSLVHIISSSLKNDSVKIIPKLLYRGASTTFFRMPIAMGVNNVAMHLGDKVYDVYKKTKNSN